MSSTKFCLLLLAFAGDTHAFVTTGPPSISISSHTGFRGSTMLWKSAMPTSMLAKFPTRGARLLAPHRAGDISMGSSSSSVSPLDFLAVLQDPPGRWSGIIDVGLKPSMRRVSWIKHHPESTRRRGSRGGHRPFSASFRASQSSLPMLSRALDRQISVSRTLLRPVRGRVLTASVLCFSLVREASRQTLPVKPHSSKLINFCWQSQTASSSPQLALLSRLSMCSGPGATAGAHPRSSKWCEALPCLEKLALHDVPYF